MKRNNDDEEEEGETNIENKTQQQLLPQDLITEILLRLPVKSLIHFKCVCKSWLSLISDPHFAISHFDLIPVERTNRLLFINIHTSETRSIDFEASLNDDAAIASLNLNFLHPQSYLSLQIGGSCRGFLFLHSYQDFYLWNPSTGIHTQIPCSPIASNVDTRFFTYLYGFGYDPSTDDYLVVLGSCDPTNVFTYFKFFSLRANTWKEIQDAHCPCLNASDSPSPRVGTLFNGAIHWSACSTSSVVIVAFDLMERRILEIPFLDDIDFYDDSIDYNLWVCGGFMSLWGMDFEDNAVEIWVMKEYGVNLSWTKILVLSIGYFSPICSTNSGDIVGSDGRGGLVKYNDNGQLKEHRSYSHHPYESQAAVYTESLLPLPLPRDTQQP